MAEKLMLINVVAGQECRIAIVSGGALEELYIERASAASHVGNIYKGRVTNVESAIQAAFVDFGGPKNGFLHISDLHPQYFPKGRKAPEPVGRKHPHRDRPPIQDCLRRGQEVVVQMTKEGIGTKGPTLTTYLSIPGRLLVTMPGMSRLGVSRKIEDFQARGKAREVLAQLDLPQDMGFILRTAGMDRSKRELQRDLNYLMRLWKAVEERINTSRAPAEIYQESDLVIRTIRDVFNSEITRIICDDETMARKVKEFLDVAVPRTKTNIELYVGREGLFQDFGVESEIEKIYSRRVELRSGGSLVIDQTEALVAIDVNSGRFRQHSDAETTALKINLEAAGEITRQLRLRDMGGVIIIDFIDMRHDKNRRAVERAVRDALRNDRAKTKTLRMSSFGIVEMTRQRVRPSLKDSIYRVCAHCNGMGLIKSEESLSLMAMRSIQRALGNDAVARIEVSVSPAVAHHLSNKHRSQISALETKAGKQVVVRADADLSGEEIRLTCTNSRGSAVAVAEAPSGKRQEQPPPTISIDELDRTARSEEDRGAEAAAPGTDEQPRPGSSRRKRRRRKKKPAAQTQTAAQTEPPPKNDRAEQGQTQGDQPTEKKKKRRRRRSRKKKTAGSDAQPAPEKKAEEQKPG